jgi:putative copper resistance protein D
VVTDGALDIVDAYRLFTRTLEPAGLRGAPPAPAHVEFLIDRNGYLRARWIPEGGRPSWADLAILRHEIQILEGEAAAPPPEEHVH